MGSKSLISLGPSKEKHPQWPSSAFGEGQPLQDPDGDGQLTTLNLRFPGQYYDAESGLHYNFFRYYDPRLGRYIQADPIGVTEDFSSPKLQTIIAQGANLRGVSHLHEPFRLNHLYGYAGQNPLTKTDPFGLRPIPGNVKPSTRCKLRCYDQWLIGNTQSTVVCAGSAALVTPSGPGALAVHATCKTSTALGHYDLAKCLSQCPDSDEEECNK